MDLIELHRNKAVHINRHPWEITRARIIQFFINKRKFFFNHIADIGSGDNYILKTLQQTQLTKNFSAVDIGYTDIIINKLISDNSAGRIKFYKTQTELDSLNQIIDCVLLLDVLEHCEDDLTVISSITDSPSINISSKFIISVPAFQCLFSKHDHLLSHYRRYNLKSLTKLCKASGLNVIHSGYFFFSLVPFRIVQKLFEKTGLSNPKKSIDNWTGGKIKTKLISTILWIDFRICYLISNWGIKLPGLSCYCICQKLP